MTKIAQRIQLGRKKTQGNVKNRETDLILTLKHRNTTSLQLFITSCVLQSRLPPTRKAAAALTADSKDRWLRPLLPVNTWGQRRAERKRTASSVKLSFLLLLRALVSPHDPLGQTEPVSRTSRCLRLIWTITWRPGCFGSDSEEYLWCLQNICSVWLLLARPLSRACWRRFLPVDPTPGWTRHRRCLFLCHDGAMRPVSWRWSLKTEVKPWSSWWFCAQVLSCCFIFCSCTIRASWVLLK